jgi:hypothetical protein
VDMKSTESRNTVALIGLFVASLIVSIGTVWAFQRGADDFNVFYVAWQHIARGEPMEIYRVSPDRFLYAPGFAWLLSPLAWLPRNLALAIWCFAKAALVGWMVRAFAQRTTSENSIFAAGLAAWGVLLVARPLLIDFQYGQVNLLILASCVWALLCHSDSRTSETQGFLSWMFAGIAAIAKLFPLPLLIVPFFVTTFKSGRLPSRKLSLERAGVLVGVALALFIPVLSVGWSGWLSLMHQWQGALIDRGFPLESHNQSFGAFLQHYTSGAPTEIIAQHRRQLSLGYSLFSAGTIQLLSAAWSAVFAGLILTWILSKPASMDLRFSAHRDRWIAVIVGLLVLPSHLVWKPYFVMGLPAALIAVRYWNKRWPVLLAIGLLMNFSGFDTLGQEWGARFEAASILLWCHLALLLASFTRSEATMSESRP